jgi:hypothetical protein
MGVRTGTSTEHRYQLCRDEFCDRFICRVYQEGRRDGYGEGHRRGWDEGYTAGYSKGFPDGQDACPLPHQ